MILCRLPQSESSCKLLQNRGHFFVFFCCSSQWIEKRFTSSLAWIREKKKPLLLQANFLCCRTTTLEIFQTVFEYSVAWYGTLAISVKPYSFVSFHQSVNLCFRRKSQKYRDSRLVQVKKKVFTKIEIENGIRSDGFIKDVLERKTKEEKGEQRWSVKVIFRPINSKDQQK